MSTNSNDQGRAYEYAWLKTLYRALSQIRNTRIEDNSSLDANKRAWSAMSDAMRQRFEISAASAVDALLALEPVMIEDAEDELLLVLQQDGVGINGDVRDIVIKRDAIQWEIGLSIKHNHEAVKHSRLSHGLDFGRQWFGIPCSNDYWNAVKPVFDRLKLEKIRGTKWSELHDKDETVYIPLLYAFIDEVNRAYLKDADVPKKMVEYLIGTNDYYKVVSHDRKCMTSIHTFNVHGTLNQSGKTAAEFTLPVAELPTELTALRLKANSTNTVEMYLDHDWKLSFRIHNASTRVEPSLKFDVQFISMPASIWRAEYRWKM